MSNKALYDALAGGSMLNAYRNTNDREACPDCGVAGHHGGLFNVHNNDCVAAQRAMLQVIQTALAALPGPTPAPHRTVGLPDGYRWLNPDDVLVATDMYKHSWNTHVTDPEFSAGRVGTPAGHGTHTTGDGATRQAGYCRKVDAVPTPLYRTSDLPPGWRWLNADERVRPSEDSYCWGCINGELTDRGITVTSTRSLVGDGKYASGAQCNNSNDGERSGYVRRIGVV